LVDYLGISLPLIACAFIATGLAISTLFCQLLTSVDLSKIIDSFSHTQQLSWTQHIMLRVVKSEAQTINTQYMPIIHAKLYALVLGKTFLTQLGPMLTALLLVGRIGGSYTGEIAMMQATQQNALLRTLGLSARRWTLLPTAIATVIAAPILTLTGSAVALLMAGLVSVHGTHSIYLSMAEYWQNIEPQICPENVIFWKLPLVIAIYRSLGFMLIILVVSELCGRFKPHLQPRDVPKTITWAIVLASLLILIADWGFTTLVGG
jgi:ABC-type transporter Mla maintaining outer membrane lipid asymmetry permease subunit MlaE